MIIEQEKTNQQKALELVKEIVEIRQSFACDHTLEEALQAFFMDSDAERIDVDKPGQCFEMVGYLTKYFLIPENLNGFSKIIGSRSELLSDFLIDLKWLFETLDNTICRLGLITNHLSDRTVKDDTAKAYIKSYTMELEEVKALQAIHSKYYPKN